MSARTPFMPFGGQSKSMPSSNSTANGPTFVPNPGNALHRGSANSDTENTSLGLELNGSLPLAGLLGQKPKGTASHGTSASKNLLQMATIATLNRPQTAAPGRGSRGDSGGSRSKQFGASSANTDNSFEGIMSPVPIKIAQQKPSILTSPTIGPFKTPALPFQADTDHSLGLFNAHIFSDLHSQRRIAGTPVRQQPSPDPSNQSGSSDEQMVSADISGSFRTSTPSDRSHEHGVGEIRARRVPNHDNHGGYYDRSNNRRHSRDDHPNEDDQPHPPSKRQRSSLEPLPRKDVSFDGDEPDEPSLQPYHDHPDTAAPNHSCILGHMLNYNVDRFLHEQTEHFQNRVHIWENASDEDWAEGAEELKQKFNKMLKKTQDYVKRKQDLFTTLENRIVAHQEYLQDREQALIAAKQNLVSDSQSVLGGKFNG